MDESSKEENVFRWPPQNILKWDKYNELPDLIDAHGRGHKMAIIKPSNSRVDTTEPDEIFESEEGDFSDWFTLCHTVCDNILSVSIYKSEISIQGERL